jgi:thymidine kinase
MNATTAKTLENLIQKIEKHLEHIKLITVAVKKVAFYNEVISPLRTELVNLMELAGLKRGEALITFRGLSFVPVKSSVKLADYIFHAKTWLANQ